MQRLYHDQPIPEEFRGAVLALGNFDGFHLGHQAVVSRAIALGFHLRRSVIVATFDPHPVRHFRPDVPPFRLTTLDQRESLFAHAGADAMLVFRFGAELAAMDAEQFVADVLVKRIGAVGVVTGDDFSFGKGRSGDVALLRDIGERHGVTAEAVSQVLIEGERVSSGRIREALIAADMGMATRLLTRAYAIEGVVERGDGRGGAELNCPTANIRLSDYQRPAYGIYSVRVRLDDGSEYPGVASLGVRPMFDPPVELLEANLFDFSGDLYGRTIEVGLHHYIRPEMKFDSMGELAERMKQDADEARRLLALPE
ncbi:bifunctional riboflavin kinase/FAD synthetase [Sphingomonas daechungensis]|uniref:bifunctional riboflavin kinase/FAD synthetase n=1 Tax=Sphingomonas daechungensis TaxID=1176646 RepID=UPI0031E53CBA